MLRPWSAQGQQSPACSTATDLLAFCFPRCAAGTELQPCPAEERRAAGKGSSCCSTFSTLTFNTEHPTAVLARHTHCSWPPHYCKWWISLGQEGCWRESRLVLSHSQLQVQELRFQKSIASTVSSLILTWQCFFPGAFGVQHEAQVYFYHWPVFALPAFIWGLFRCYSIFQKDLEQEHKPCAVISAERPSENTRASAKGRSERRRSPAHTLAWQAEAVAFISPWSSAFSPRPSAHSRQLYLIKNFQQAGPAALLGAKCHIWFTNIS